MPFELPDVPAHLKLQRRPVYKVRALAVVVRLRTLAARPRVILGRKAQRGAAWRVPGPAKEEEEDIFRAPFPLLCAQPTLNFSQRRDSATER